MVAPKIAPPKMARLLPFAALASYPHSAGSTASGV